MNLDTTQIKKQVNSNLRAEILFYELQQILKTNNHVFVKFVGVSKRNQSKDIVDISTILFQDETGFTNEAVDTPICSELLKLIKKRNFEGALVKIKALQDVIAANATVLTTNGMKADLPIILQTAHAAITTKSNLQTDLIKQRKSFTNTNKGVYKELYAYITDVCKLGKIIFQGTPKAEEYTIEKILQKMHVTK